MLFVQTLAAAMLPSLAAATLPQQQTNGSDSHSPRYRSLLN